MKKLLIVLIILMPALTIFGQTTKGKFVLSGGTNLQFSSTNVEPVFNGNPSTKTKESSISFMPTIGYFVIDNLAIGLSGDFSTSTQKNDNFGKGITTSVSIIPMAMYYFPMEGKIRPLLQIGAGYSSMVQKITPVQRSEQKNSNSGFIYNFGGGIAYFIAENISFDFGVSYKKTNLKDNNTMELKQETLGGSIGISVFL